VPPQNSLRALGALRSNSCGESVHDARCARRTGALRCSAPQRRPPPRAPARAGCFWCCMQPPSPLCGLMLLRRPRCRRPQMSWLRLPATPSPFASRPPGAGVGDLCGGEARRGACRRAQRAPSHARRGCLSAARSA